MSYNATLQLAFLTPSDELLGVLIHRWLEEPALPDFGLCAEYSIMAPYGAAWHFSMICSPSAICTHLLNRPSEYTLYRYGSSQR
jgi:hypothetical protein